jgi:hypothetical protein
MIAPDRTGSILKLICTIAAALLPVIVEAARDSSESPDKTES